ncbi:MAG: hypothetical protein HY043_13025, partial [Verrucomicrobia bacterium]|nr:hypothetical protein [Verrucomicrobiota bacterium]
MKTILLGIVGSALNLWAQRSTRMLRARIGMLVVATGLPLTPQPAFSSVGGLVGYWKFDEWVGPVAMDASGCGNHGLLQGNAQWQSTRQHPVALLFDGVNASVNVGNATSLNPTDQITLAAWIAPYDLRASGEIIAKSNGTDPQYELRVQAGGKIRFGISGEVLDGNLTLSLANWHLVAGTYDGSTMKIYVDGVLDAFMSKSGPMHDNGVEVLIGSRAFQTALVFDGLIDDPQIYNRALSASEVQALGGTGDLVGYWKFDESGGTVAGDASSYGNNGQLLGGPQWQSTPQRPVALLFDGVNDLVNVGNTPSLNPPDQITLAAWISPYDLSSSGEVIAKSNGTDPQYYLRVQAGGRIRFGISGTVLNGNLTLSPANWHLVAGTYDGSMMKIYVDGVLDAFMSKSGPMHDNGVEVWIGARRFQTPLVFKGLIDDPRIYNRALAANEIQALAAPGQVVITSPPNGQTFVQYIFDPPLSVAITAGVSNFSAAVTKVDFYEHSELIGTATQEPYSIVYQNPSIGLHDQIVAVATDTLGNTVSSDPNAFSFYVCFYDDLHYPDYVKIVSPPPGSVFNYGDPISISVGIRDNCGVWFAVGIDLYADGVPLAHLTPPNTLDFVWQNAPIGIHSILARSTSNNWLEDYLGITVVAPGNQAPTVNLIRPHDGDTLPLGTPIDLEATASDSDGFVTQVYFIVDDMDLIRLSLVDDTSPYLITYTPPHPGQYHISAFAVDNNGLEGSSVPTEVVVNVIGRPPTIVSNSPPDGAGFLAPANILV